MNIKFKDFISIRDTLATLQQLSRVKLRTAYEISRFMTTTEHNFQFYIDKLNEYLQKYGEKNEAGELLIENNSYIIKKEYLEECNKALEELDNLEIEIREPKIWIDDFENTYIDVSILNPIIPFIIEYN